MNKPVFASGPRRDAAYLVLVAVVGILIAVVNTFTTIDDLRQVGRQIPSWEPAVWEGSSVIVVVALAPAVMWLTRAIRPFEASWPRVIGVHALAATAFSAVHVGGMLALRWIAYAVAGAEYGGFRPLAIFPYELRKDLLTYLALASVYLGWLRLTSVDVEQEAAQPPAIEVRDGARRRFVPLAEVDWIEAAGNYVELHRGPTPILHRAPLSQLERELEGHGFVRIHRSRLVRRAAIEEVESKPSGDYVVRLSDGRELGGSRRFRRPLLEP